MATSAPTTVRLSRVRVRPAILVPLGLGLLAALSVVVRTQKIGSGLWVDEGLSFGIADRPLADIPGVMRLDGSPPLYYMLVHVWTRALGVRSEEWLHALSLVFAVAAIGVAFAFARSLFGARAGWLAAVLVAANPFLNQYAQEARMYALVVLLSVCSVGCFLGAFAFGRGRRWTVGFAVSHALLLYTHNWGLFLGAGLAAAWVVLLVGAEGDRRRAIRNNGLLGAAVILVLYAPWLPTLAFQVAHTGAPWANAPNAWDLYSIPRRLLGYTSQWLLLLGGGGGLLALMRGPLRRWRPEGQAALALIVTVVVAMVVPWLLSQANPAWALRYLAIGVAPLVLLAALGTARTGWLGVAAVTLVALIGAGAQGPTTKSNVRSVASVIAPSLAPGDTVISTQPEQVPVLHYYLHRIADLRYASITGPVTDLGVTDWRDGVDRLTDTSVARDLEPVLATVRPGQRVALVTPDFSILARWRAPWSRIVRARSLAWEDAMRNDTRFRVVAVEPPNPVARPNEVRATLFERQPVPSSPSSRPAGAA